MADNKTGLAEGFEEVPLNEGFEEVPLNSSNEPSMYQKFLNYTKGPAQTAEDFAQGAGKSMFDTQLVPALTATGASLTGTAPDLSWAQKYRQAQDLLQQQQNVSQQRSPDAFRTGELGGAILPSIATAGAMAPEAAAAGAAETIAPSLAQKIGTGALEGGVSGAGIGALQGASTSQGNLIDSTPEERAQLLKDAATGTVLGAGFGTVLGGTAGALRGQGSNVMARLKAAGALGIAGTLAGGAAGAIIPGVTTQQGAILGGTVGAGTGLFKSPEGIEEFLDNSPGFRHAILGFDKGTQGINITSQAAKEGELAEERLLPEQIGPTRNPGLIRQSSEDARMLMNGIYDADQQLGKAVGDALNPDITPAAANPIDLTDPMINSLDQLKNSMENNRTILSDPNAQKLYDKIFQLSDQGDLDTTTLTPQEVNSLRNDVSDFAASIKSQNPGLANLGFDFASQARDLLGKAIPEYDVAATRFAQFRALVPETIMSKGVPVDYSQIRLGNLKNSDLKLYNATLDMINGAQKSGNANSAAQKTALDLFDNYNKFENLEGQRLANGDIDQDDLLKILPQTTSDPRETQYLKQWVNDKADQSALLQKVWGENPQEGVGTTFLGSLTGSKTGPGVVVNVGNKLGLANASGKQLLEATKASPPGVLAQKIYNAPEQGLKDLATKMSQVPGLQSVGQTLLDGLENKNSASVNAAIFSILQNPQARIMVNGEDLNNKQQGNQ